MSKPYRENGCRNCNTLEATLNGIKASYITNENKRRGIPLAHGNIFIVVRERDIDLKVLVGRIDD